VKLSATIGATTWTTQVMPQPGGCCVLPVKQAVVRAEGLAEGTQVAIALSL
jgi:hypothetical protein